MVLLKENMRRFFLFPILTTLVYILAVIVPLFSARQNTHEAVHAIVNILHMRQMAVLLGMVIVPFITACLVFGFFYRAKESALVQSFPLNRTQVLLNSVLSGIVLMLIPTLILSIGLLLMPIRLEGAELLQGRGTASLFNVTEGLGIESIRNTINSFSVVVGFFLRMMIAKIFYFALFWLAFSLTGQAIATILLAGVMPLIPFGVAVLINSVARYYVFGFYSWNYGFSALMYSNPGLWVMLIIHRIPLIWFYLWFIALTLVLMCSAFIISRLRKPERVGNPALFKPIKHVLVFLVSLTFMIFGGILFWEFTDSHLMFYVGLFIGFLIGFIIAQMIAEKSLSIIHKARSFPIFASVVLVMFLLMLFVTQVGMRFYTNYIPRQEDIVGVNFLPGTSFHQWYTPNFNEDSEIIALTVDVHSEIINNKALLFQPWRIRFGRHVQRYYYDINYLMTDGRIIMRRYQLNSEFIQYLDIPRIMQGIRAERVEAEHE